MVETVDFFAANVVFEQSGTGCSTVFSYDLEPGRCSDESSRLNKNTIPIFWILDLDTKVGGHGMVIPRGVADIRIHVLDLFGIGDAHDSVFHSTSNRAGHNLKEVVSEVKRYVECLHLRHPA